MRQGLLLSDTTLARTGHRLLALLYAEYEWGDLRRDDDPDVLDDFIAESVDRISEDLVSLAAMARAADDELETLSELKGSFPSGVGMLRIGDTTRFLSPREACNKVLHARRFRYHLEFSELNPLYANYYQRMSIDRPGRFKSPILILDGEQHSSTWIAEIQAVPFVIATSAPNVHLWAFA